MRKFIYQGFTLFELIISLIIIGIISTLSLSSYSGIVANQALASRANQVYYTLQWAKSEAIKRNKKIYVKFCEQEAQWKMGVSETPHCDCFTPDSCQLAGDEKVQPLADNHQLFIDKSLLTFTGDQASYGPMRFSVETGTIVLSNSENNALSIIQSASRLRICSPNATSLGQPIC